jgi:hypothetical protein
MGAGHLDEERAFDLVSGLCALDEGQTGVHGNLGGIDFRAVCHGCIPKADLPPQDAAILARFADQVADIDDECRRTGRVTDEALKLIDANLHADRLLLYRQLFGREPTS